MKDSFSPFGFINVKWTMSKGLIIVSLKRFRPEYFGLKHCPPSFEVKTVTEKAYK
jgi:hypothetical protein